MKIIKVLLLENNNYDFEATSRKLKYILAIQKILHFSTEISVQEFLQQSVDIQNQTNRFIPNLILLDLSFYSEKSIALILKIRASQSLALQNIPIITLSENADDSLKLDCFNAGANGFLSKPIDVNYLTDFLIKFELI